MKRWMTTMLVGGLAMSVARADTHTAASCSQADVQAAVNAASDGDTVLIPNGSATWSGGIATTKQIVIRAQSYTPTSGGNAMRNVVITNNSTAPLFALTSGNSFHCGIAGIKFVEGTQKSNFVRLEGSGAKVPLVSDCWFDIDERFGDEPDVAILAVLSLGGVIWNCRFDTPGTDFQGYPGSQGASVYLHSPRDWYTASTMGALDSNGAVNVYFEDCTFFNCSGCPDADDNARVVFRHCVFDGTGGLTHGFTSLLGGRHFEYYDNTFTVTTPERNQPRYFWCRAGTGIFTDNVVNDNVTPSAFGSQTLLDIGDNTDPTGMGAYPIARQPGWGHNGTSSVSDPIYIWNNTGSRAYTWSHNTQAGPWDQYVQLSRDLFVNRGAKPGYAKYTYPHPRRQDGLAPLPEGAGLAAAYVRDGGIGGHPAVLFTDDFEGYPSGRISWSDLGGWDNVWGDMVITRAVANVNNGLQAVEVTCTGTQETGAGAVKEVAGQDVIFVRWYMKYHPQFPGVHHSGASVRGGKTGELFSNPTGTVPRGTDHFLAMYDHLSPLHGWNPPANTTPPGWGYNYCYHMDQGSSYGDVLLPSGDLNGNYPFSPDFIPRPNVTPARNRWTCFELMVEANTLGQADGRVGLWMDGTLIADHPGLRFRTIAELKARYITPVAVYASEVRPNQTMWYDDVVIATQYIGPMAGSSAPVITVPPTNRTVFAGQTATFSVTVTGTAPLAYRWQKNGANIGGATSDSYTTPATVLGDDGALFRVIVTNSLGSVTSSVATLTVLPPDTTRPTVSLTAPAAGATVSNTVTVSATATDNVAVAGVQFRLDGVSDLGAEDTVSPYSISWDTAGAANGIHALTAVARDTAGNLTTSDFITVTVTNTGGSLMGNNGEGTTTDHISDGSGSYINASRFLAASSFTATVIKAKVLGIPGKYQCAVYSDHGGVPQALLRGTAEVTNPSTGWQTFPLTSAQAIQGGAYYWLAIWSDLPSTSAGIYGDTSGGSTRWTGVAPYGAWPDPIATTGGSDVRYCIYAEGPANGDVLVNGLPSSWLIQYFGSTNAPNGGPLDDGDGDGMHNDGEWQCGTIPTNRLSVLRITDWRIGSSSNLVMGWPTVTGKRYTIQATTNLLLGFPEVVSNPVLATPPTNTQTLPLGPEPQKFYRVMVE